jgi:hypothetical protein
MNELRINPRDCNVRSPGLKYDHVRSLKRGLLRSPPISVCPNIPDA